jgi:hypothetical protein
MKEFLLCNKKEYELESEIYASKERKEEQKRTEREGEGVR